MIPNKFFVFLDLARLNNPIGYLLLFMPCLIGIAFGFNNISDFKYSIIFFIGSIFARGAGCIINDIFDQDIDKNVKRTKNRPLANKSLTNIEAVIFFIILTFCSLITLFFLKKNIIYLVFTAAILIIIYPLMKRITYFPQIFLGITFNLGVLISYVNIKNYISLGIFLTYLGLICWTIVYDTIYGFMDYKYDIKAGVKSLSILLFNRYYKIILNIINLISLSLICIGFYVEYNYFSTLHLLFLFFCFILNILQVNSIKLYNSSTSMKVFKSNIFNGILIFLGIFLGKLNIF